MGFGGGRVMEVESHFVVSCQGIYCINMSLPGWCHLHIFLEMAICFWAGWERSFGSEVLSPQSSQWVSILLCWVQLYSKMCVFTQALDRSKQAQLLIQRNCHCSNPGGKLVMLDWKWSHSLGLGALQGSSDSSIYPWRWSVLGSLAFSTQRPTSRIWNCIFSLLLPDHLREASQLLCGERESVVSQLGWAHWSIRKVVNLVLECTCPEMDFVLLYLLAWFCPMALSRKILPSELPARYLKVALQGPLVLFSLGQTQRLPLILVTSLSPFTFYSLFKKNPYLYISIKIWSRRETIWIGVQLFC